MSGFCGMAVASTTASMETIFTRPRSSLVMVKDCRLMIHNGPVQHRNGLCCTGGKFVCVSTFGCNKCRSIKVYIFSSGFQIRILRSWRLYSCL